MSRDAKKAQDCNYSKSTLIYRVPDIFAGRLGKHIGNTRTRPAAEVSADSEASVPREQLHQKNKKTILQSTENISMTICCYRSTRPRYLSNGK